MRGVGFSPALRPARAAIAAAALALACLPAGAVAQQIVPPNFFDLVPPSAGQNIAISADTLIIDQTTDTAIAQGNVGINFEGLRVTADRAVYDRATGAVTLEGNVALIDQDGLEYVADRVELEGDFRNGFIEALTVAFPDGTYFSAAETTLTDETVRTYDDALYSPCGTCIDEQGRRIGWQVRAVRVITDAGEQVISFTEPQLELLGIPVMWLPYLSLPQGEEIEFPILDYREQYGVRASFPFFRYRINGGTLLFTPSLFSRQGAMLGAEWSQRVGDFSYEIAGSAIYQLDPSAYTGLASTEFRGALEGAFTFTPTSEWTFGGEYTLFSDPAYLPNYGYRSGTARNQLYAEYFTAESFADIRVQQFVPLSNASTWAAYDIVRDRQAVTLPNARGDHVVDLEDGMGRVTFEGSLLALNRQIDHAGPLGSTWGYAGQSIHAMGQASWTNQYVLGGALVSPYLGLRADAADFNSQSARPGAPDTQSLFGLTPIAALDLRYPLAISGAGATTVVEPIVQLVYRGSEQSIPGITNDNAHGVVLDATNLFDFDRFSGSDRQETGLRANIGGQLETQFDNGVWLNLVAGQSFQLDGANAFAVDDGTITGLESGLDTGGSYIVAGAAMGFTPHLSASGKLQYDPDTGVVPRALAILDASYGEIDLGLSYIYNNADPRPNAAERHEIAVDATLPIMDYWSLSGGVAWDLAANHWLQATAGIQYNDGYLAYGIAGRLTGPTHTTPDDLRLTFNIKLSTKGQGEILGLGTTFEPEIF